ncbi:WD40 repeat-like protein [Rhizoclosmatium globosum]|uniref:WD40 repeat-like protein n=1 Tax=Rhizoclosmatium globosum TaxID=329046 RepID=A0A1Y2D1N0_9FUNG|nr:WD40 repeat-like protein [Rhizoclosmatium globosum]|eukprot:ORY53034.1 WD40 repeat-like protein [Rhizoclosmatium globosum]
MSSRPKDGKQSVTIGFPVFALAFAPKKAKVFVGGGGGASRSGVKNTVAMYTVNEYTLSLEPVAKHEFGSDEDSVQSICVHPKEKTIVVGANQSQDRIKQGSNENCRIFTLKDETLLYQTSISTVDGLKDSFQKVARFSPDGKYLLTGGTDGKLSVWSWPECHNVIPALDMEGEIADANFDSASTMFVALTSKKCVVISLAKGKTVWSIDKPVVTQSADAAEFRSARFGSGSSEGYLFMAVNAKSRKQSYICKWKTDKWAMERSKLVAVKPITAFNISYDGELLTFGAADSSVNILSAKGLQSLLKVPNAHNFPITSLSFSPTGLTLVSGSADGTCNVIAVPLGPAGSSPLSIIIIVLLVLFALWLLVYLASGDSGVNEL